MQRTTHLRLVSVLAFLLPQPSLAQDTEFDHLVSSQNWQAVARSIRWADTNDLASLGRSLLSTQGLLPNSVLEACATRTGWGLDRLFDEYYAREGTASQAEYLVRYFGPYSLERRIVRHCTDHPTQGAVELLTRVITLHPDEQFLTSLAKDVLPLPPFATDANLLYQVIRFGSERTLRRLQRYVFRTTGPPNKVLAWLAAVAAISDRDQRTKKLSEGIRKLKEGQDPPRTNLDPPEGFELVGSPLGVGKTGRVYLVRRTSDQALFAWKVGVLDSEEVAEHLEREIDLSRIWRELGVSKVFAEWDPERRGLLKTYIPGTRLKASR